MKVNLRSRDLAVEFKQIQFRQSYTLTLTNTNVQRGFRKIINLFLESILFPKLTLLCSIKDCIHRHSCRRNTIVNTENLLREKI